MCVCVCVCASALRASSKPLESLSQLRPESLQKPCKTLKTKYGNKNHSRTPQILCARRPSRGGGPGAEKVLMRVCVCVCAPALPVLQRPWKNGANSGLRVFENLGNIVKHMQKHKYFICAPQMLCAQRLSKEGPEQPHMHTQKWFLFDVQPAYCVSGGPLEGTPCQPEQIVSKNGHAP